MADGGKLVHFSGLRVLYFGMAGILSRVPLTLLLNADVQVVGLVLPAALLPPFARPRDGRVPVIPPSPTPGAISLTPPNILQVAAERRLPVYPVRRLRDPETLSSLTAVAPDLICVSCFDQILPPALLALPRFGCLNLHPSRLPHFRGPSPLFWLFREGVNPSGVTVHFMDEGIDTGDIALQAAVTFPDGLTGAQAEQVCAERGGRLLLDAIRQLAAGTLPRRPQPAGGSYWPAPGEADFRLDTGWPARRAFNFMRATDGWARPYPVSVAGRMVWLRTAVACHPKQTLPQPLVEQGEAVAIQFSPGVLVATYTGQP